jgi:hypothetical protein
MNEPMFTTRIYKTDKGWSFENIMTDVLPNSANTFCTDWPKCNAWREMMYCLNSSSKMIARIKERELLRNY